MRRRDFITLLGGGVVAWPQLTGERPTIGFLGTATPSAWSQWTAAFVQRLSELGWIDGRTVAIVYRWAEGREGALCGDRRQVRQAQSRRYRHVRRRCACGNADDLGHSDCVRDGK